MKRWNISRPNTSLSFESLISVKNKMSEEDPHKCGQFLFPGIPPDELPNTKQEVNLDTLKKPKAKKPTEEVWTFKKFEQKLSNGMLLVPALKLKHIPKSIFGFSPPLRTIYLNDNDLRELPRNFFDDLPALTWLDVRNNKLTHLPELKNPHDELHTLLIQNNEIEQLSPTLARAKNLSRILFHGNPIEDPPSDILQSGTVGIMDYLNCQLNRPNAYDDEDESSESEMDEDTYMEFFSAKRQQSLPTTASCDSIIVKKVAESVLCRSSKDQDLIPQSKILKTLYSDALWRYKPVEGPSPYQKLAKAQEELRQNVERNIAAQKEAILQRMRDNEARADFKEKTRNMQLRGDGSKKAKAYKGPNPPFGINQNKTENKPNILPLDEFRQEFLGCWERLTHLTANKIPLNNVEEAKKRLEEVEDIQRKISNMKLTMKPRVLT